MDLVLPGGMDGAEATKEIVSTCPGTRVLALTSFSDPELIQRVLRAGALGCLLKNVSGKELAEAIRRAHAGTSTLAPEAADALVRAISSPVEARAGLTRRERDVLKLMVEGLTNAEIGERLVVSLSTVKTHVSSIIAKLGASTRTEAAAIAVREHLDYAASRRTGVHARIGHLTQDKTIPVTHAKCVHLPDVRVRAPS